MYNLPYHKENDPREVSEFIEKHPFAFLSGCNANNQPVATQVPVFMEERAGRKFLSGHIMRNTDHHKAFEHNNNVLVIFTGKHTYVSGAWYSDPHTASTWNYMSVQAKGKINFLDGDALVEMLRKTSLHFEKYNRDSPTIYDNLSKTYVDKLIKAVVAFEIEVDKLDTVFKLSQDRDLESFNRIIQKLREQGEDGQEIASEMEKRKDRLFDITR